MKRFNKKSFEPLDSEEKELMESIEREEWRPVDDLNQEKQKAIEAAGNTLKKDKRINLRLSQKDYHQIQIRGGSTFSPYDTYIRNLIVRIKAYSKFGQ